jgi:GT2 family glycosyltransferase
VILVDNARNESVRQYVEYLQAKGQRRIVYVPNVNDGYTGGNVRGVKHATGKYVMITNADTILRNNTIEELVRDFSRRPANVMVLVPKILIRETDVINSIGMKKIRPAENIYTNIGYLEHDLGQFDAPRKVEAFDGAAFMFRRSLLESTFLFDPNFFFGSDATDLAERIGKLGFEMWTCPPAIVRHHLRGSVHSSEVNERLTEITIRNALIHTLKNTGFGMFLRTLVVGMLYRNILARIVTRQHPRMAIIYLRGVARFFLDLGLFLRY